MTGLGPDRIYGQYRTKPKAVAWYEITRTIGGDLCAAFEAIQNSYDVYTATGAQLDVIARIVVIDRTVLESITFDECEFNDDGDNEFGDSDDCQFGPVSVLADGELSDEYYRILILSKIVKNNSDATIEGIIESILTMIPNANFVTVNDGEDMTFSIEINGALTPIQTELILNKDIIPKPQGVRFNGFTNTLGVIEFNSEGLYNFGDDESEFAGFI